MHPESSLHPYQTRGIDHIIRNPESMLWIDMGLGKTVMCLTAAAKLMDCLASYGMLVIAPKRVVESVWAEEARKWQHLSWLRVHKVHGSPDLRTRRALQFAHVYVVSYDNIKWLADLWTKHYLSKGHPLPVDMVVLDEVTKVKNSTSKRMEHLERLLGHVTRRVGLTGTPASNGYQDLFGQFLAVDRGTRLGTTKTAFQHRFLHPEHPGSFAKLVANADAEQVIHGLVSDITVQMSNEDYLTLPPIMSNEVPLSLTPKLQKQYDDMEATMFLELDSASGRGVESFNAAALSNRCLQFAQGAVYLSPGNPHWEAVHDIKLAALDDVMEEAAGKPVLIAVQFRHDAERILARYHSMYPGGVWVDSKMSAGTFKAALNSWEAGTLPFLLAHPASLGHGVDRLKDGPVDDLVWFGHTWSLDQYEQFCARLRRQGRTRPIRMHHLEMRGTVEAAQRMALDGKATTQDGLKAALNEYRRKKHG